MSFEPNIIAYHCNDKKRCKVFIDDHSKLVWSEEEGIWLGSGMYFWDNMSNAKYWLKQKKKKNAKEEHTIIEGSLVISKMLDLTDKEICDEIQELWRAYSKDMGIDEKQPLGKKLNMLFESSPMMREYFNVIKVNGKYIKEKPSELFYFKSKGEKIEPTLGTKTIYSAKNSECLGEFHLIA